VLSDSDREQLQKATAAIERPAILESFIPLEPPGSPLTNSGIPQRAGRIWHKLHITTATCALLSALGLTFAAEQGMQKYYIFRASRGLAVTDDRTGMKLPGVWHYFDEITLESGERTVAGEATQIIACIERFGFFLWPESAQLPTRRGSISIY
jgi:hypothetical protein